MASESTTSPDQSSNDEVDKKVISVDIEHGVFSSKGNEEANTEKAKRAESAASSKAQIIESEEKIEDKLVDPAQVVEVKKVVDVPILDASTVYVEKVSEEHHKEQELSAVEAVKGESEQVPSLSDSDVGAIVGVDKAGVVFPVLEPEVPQSDYETKETPEVVATVKEVQEKSEVAEESTEKETAQLEDKTKEEGVGKDGELSAIPDVGNVEEVKQPDIIKMDNAVVGFGTEAAIDVGLVTEQKEENNVKVEDIQEKNVEVDEVKQPEITKNEDVRDSNGVTEVSEEPSEGDKASRDVEDNADYPSVGTMNNEGKPDVVDSNISVVNKDKNEKETQEDAVVKMKVLEDEEKAKDAEETVARKSKVLEEKTIDCHKIAVDTWENAAEQDKEIEKPNTPDVPETKTEGILPKQDVEAKTTKKQSKNIMSKVKKTIAKMKKAIIGKSPSSKTISSDAK